MGFEIVDTHRIFEPLMRRIQIAHDVRHLHEVSAERIALHGPHRAMMLIADRRIPR